MLNSFTVTLLIYNNASLLIIGEVGGGGVGGAGIQKQVKIPTKSVWIQAIVKLDLSAFWRDSFPGAQRERGIMHSVSRWF